MRKFALVSLVALIALPAAAADLKTPPMAVKAPVTPTPISGFYFGVNAEGAAVKSHVDWLSLPGVVQGTEYTPAGLGVGAVAGYRAWIGNAFFIAPELDGDYLFARGSSACAPGGVDTCSTKNTWGGAALVKVGVPLGMLSGQFANLVPANLPVPAVLPTSAWASALMPYIATGVRAREIGGCIQGAINQGCTTTTMWGWTVGGGAIMPVATNVNLDMSVMFDDYNKAFTPGPNGVTSLLSGTWKSTHGVTAGLALTFGY